MDLEALELIEINKNEKIHLIEMKEIIVKPHKGISIVEDGDINLGDSKDKVIELLGEALEFEGNLYYYNSSLSIELNEENLVQYIECRADKYFKVYLYGKDIFEKPVDDVIEILSKKNNGLTDKEGEYTYYFLNLSLSVAREWTKEAVEEMISEMKKDGVYESNKEDLDGYIKLSNNFSIVGIGIKDYYKK
ncbi:MAG: hypothetical protein ACRDD2_01935 [Sarcina sp.]